VGDSAISRIDSTLAGDDFGWSVTLVGTEMFRRSAVRYNTDLKIDLEQVRFTGSVEEDSILLKVFWQNVGNDVIRMLIWARRRRVIVAIVTYALLGIAFVLGILWILDVGPEWEPWVNSLTLLAGVTGLVVERQNAETERRSEVVASVVFELQQNRAIVERRLAGLRTGGERALSVSPRLALSAVDAALASGVLSRAPDSALVEKLHSALPQV